MAGLSRLEILVCLVVIGVLVSLLLFRLAELNRATRPARLQTAAAQVRTGAALFHARCEALRAAGSVTDCTRLALDGRTVAGVHGWPAATMDGIARMADLPLRGRAGIDGFALRTGQRDGRPALMVSLGETPCAFVYVQAAGPDEFPRVDIVDASCH